MGEWPVVVSEQRMREPFYLREHRFSSDGSSDVVYTRRRPTLRERIRAAWRGWSEGV